MNLAIEYITRNKIAQEMVELPSSILLTHIVDKSGIAITIHNCYGNSDQLNVKHWRIDKATKDRILPPQEEFIINRNEVFTSDKVILDDYEIIEYQEDPYQVQYKQYADEPNASIQEKQYQVCLDTFFNCKINCEKRKNWLWGYFEKILFEEIPLWGDVSMNYQEVKVETLKKGYPLLWKKWCMWEKHILCNMPHRKMSSELSFYVAYKEKLSKNPKYLSVCNIWDFNPKYDIVYTWS